MRSPSSRGCRSTCRRAWRSSGSGTAGYRLTCEGQTLYVDPYVSRVAVRDVLSRRRPALADPALHDRWLTPPGPVAGVLVGHTHFDHAVDVPELCRRTGATAYGSASLAQLMRAFGQAERCVEVTPATTYELGPFRSASTSACTPSCCSG